ncbi:P-loop NTPase fold protein [Chryseobacterium sp. ON_d1]|uniref:P-loop NTPase fold protein n=1 Tax=Chryseobacterium sp. ON_d1 TaxID=2583211 RepID=UPI0011580BD6|nr:P-loop NTPase fold protein [Chryseobacterium sp. ON_d1]GEJ45854.1 NTPase [Chryseobacterium sp. ON_d1]
MEKKIIESKYKFLANQPLGEDLFKNKSQDKIATVISEKILDEKSFKIIGIDGTWGSGKSNLIHLLQKKVEKTHKFFMYDVWGHQEDEQRKAILVELTEFIKNETDLLKKNGKKNWDHKLKILLANSKETTTINQPYLSVGFIFSLLSIVYIPTVNVFKDSIKDFFQIDSWLWKLVLVAFPIFIVIGIYIYNLIRNWKNKKVFWKSFGYAAEETFQVYTNKQKEETKIETISENQPSVRDFQKWMEEIDEDLNKKIILVFDNFDRLPKKHILNIWSSIHIFFAEKKYKNIKVILPFDREHIQNAFKELNIDGTDKTFGDDYVNKTFDIVFRVTLPIMSDWKLFFKNQWDKAFVNYDADELRLVIQVYEFLNKRITPREIIAFINEILTIKLLDENFKERYIAVFVLKKDEILQDPLRAITKLDYLDGLKSIYYNDSDFSNQITAIVYHIPVDEAIELIYTQELKDALNRNDVDRFNAICKSDFADSIFSSAIIDTDILENPIKTLSALQNNTNIPELQIKQAWKTFYYKAINDNSQVEKLEIEDWKLILIENYDDDQYLKTLLFDYAELITESNMMQYISLIDKFMNHLYDDRIRPLLPFKNINAENFIALVENKGSEYKKFRLTCNNKLIDAHISKLKIENILELKNTKIICRDFDLSNYKQHLKTNFNTAVDQNNIEKANDILLKIKETINEESTALKELLNDSQIYSLYTNNISSSSLIIDDLIAMRISRGGNFNNSYKSQFTNILNTHDESKAKEIGVKILNYVSYGELLINSEHFVDSILFKNIILSLFSDSSLDKWADINKLINNYDKIKTSLKLRDSQLLNELNEWTVEYSDLSLRNLSDEFINDCFKYSDLSISKSFIEKFNREFQGLENDGYKDIFNSENDIHFKYFHYLDSTSLTQSSLDIFKETFLSKIQESKVNGTWWTIFNKYETNNSNLSIENSLKDIRDQFLNGHIEFNIDTAKKILPLFIKYNLLDPSTDIFRTIIKNNFLSNNEFLDILLQYGDYLKNLYQATIQSQKEGFRNIINEKRDSNEKLDQLAKQIGIRKPKDK